MSVTLEGLVPVLATPFDSDGDVDYPSLDRLTRFAVTSGASGVAIFGLASEAFALCDSEREEILRHVKAIADDAVPVIAGVNSTALQPALEQAKLAADGGASALMVLPPFMVKPTPNQLVDFYGTLAARSGVPVMVQDAPSTTGVAMPVSLIADLTKLDGVVAVKVETQPTPPKVGAIVDAVGGACAVFGGQNALFCLEEFARGAVGTMPACEFTDLLAEVLATWKRDDQRGARAGFNRLLPLIRFGLQPGLAWAVHKEVLVRRRIIATNTVRSPGHSLDSATARALDAILEDLQMPALDGDLG